MCIRDRSEQLVLLSGESVKLPSIRSPFGFAVPVILKVQSCVCGKGLEIPPVRLICSFVIVPLAAPLSVGRADGFQHPDETNILSARTAVPSCTRFVFMVVWPLTGGFVSDVATNSHGPERFRAC